MVLGRYSIDLDDPTQAVGRDAQPEHEHRVVVLVCKVCKPVVGDSFEGFDEVQHGIGVREVPGRGSQLSPSRLPPGGNVGTTPRPSVEVRAVVVVLPSADKVEPNAHPSPDDGWQKADWPPTTVGFGEKADEYDPDGVWPAANDLNQHEVPKESEERLIGTPEKGPGVKFVPP